MKVLGIKTFAYNDVKTLDKAIEEWLEVASGNGLSVISMTTCCAVEPDDLWIVTQIAFGREDAVDHA